MESTSAEEKQSLKATAGEIKKDKKNSSKKTVALVCVIIVLLLVIIGLVLVIFFFKKNKDETVDKPILITKENANEVVGDLEESSTDTSFNCRMSYNWTVNDKKSEDAYVANTDYNHYPIYFEVRDDTSQKIIYQSAKIPVGSEIKGITLNQRLEQGIHPATVIYHLIDDKGEEVSSTAFTINIQVY